MVKEEEYRREVKSLFSGQTTLGDEALELYSVTPFS